MTNEPTTAPSNERGRFDETVKPIITRNVRELSSVKGNLLSASGGTKLRTLMVTSSVGKEGKTVAGISLAYALSVLGGARTLLVDGNILHPNLHTLFNVEPAPGLMEAVYSGKCDETAFRRTEFNNLTLLPQGGDRSHWLELFESDRFGTCLKQLSEKFDFVILEAPPVLASSEVSVIAPLFDGILFVVRCETTKWEVVQLSVDKITAVGGKVLGSVLNRRKFYIPKIFYGLF